MKFTEHQLHAAALELDKQIRALVQQDYPFAANLFYTVSPIQRLVDIARAVAETAVDTDCEDPDCKTLGCDGDHAPPTHPNALPNYPVTKDWP